MAENKNYKEYNSRGYPIIYYIGDTVLFEGKKYECKITHTNHQPNINSLYWEKISGSVDDFYYSDTEPLSANVGDRWVDSSTGKMYTYIEDTDGFHWVQF
jgi:hypothetical protein